MGSIMMLGSPGDDRRFAPGPYDESPPGPLTNMIYSLTSYLALGENVGGYPE
jgi:hypothetical protein